MVLYTCMYSGICVISFIPWFVRACVAWSVFFVHFGFILSVNSPLLLAPRKNHLNLSARTNHQLGNPDGVCGGQKFTYFLNTFMFQDPRNILNIFIIAIFTHFHLGQKYAYFYYSHKQHFFKMLSTFSWSLRNETIVSPMSIYLQNM